MSVQRPELPVTMLDLRPMVSVKINGADARLIADSGAFAATAVRQQIAAETGKYPIAP